MRGIPEPGAIAVVLRAGKVLLAQRGKAPDRGLWGFPGGHVAPGETTLQAAARELAEETGVIAEPVECLTNLEVLRRDAAGEVVAHYLLAVVLCEYRSGTPAPADDVVGAAWVDLDTIRAGRLPMSPRVAELTELAVARAQARRRRDDTSASTAAESR